MRPIKFRCFIKSTKKLLPVVSLVDMNDEEGIRIFPQGYTRNFLTSELDIELMQFTWLLDKNVKEIYEGDIVKFDQYTAKIHWYNRWARWATHVLWEEISEWDINIFDAYPPEIIWNIYENPDLISVTN